jgi:hypothetical protein
MVWGRGRYETCKFIRFGAVDAALATILYVCSPSYPLPLPPTAGEEELEGLTGGVGRGQIIFKVILQPKLLALKDLPG